MNSNIITNDSVIQDAALALTKFGRFIKLTDENTKGLIGVASTVKQIMNNASNEINKASSEFKKTLKDNPYEHPILLVYMFEMTNMFQRVSKFFLDYSLILNNDFLEPLNLFHTDSSRHNLKIFKELETLVTNLEKTKKSTKLSKETYYQFSAQSEKSEDKLKSMFDKIEKGIGNEKDLMKETEKVAQIKMNAQEAKIEYEGKCKELTNWWTDFRLKFLDNFATFDLKEENRIDQIKRKALTLGQNLRAFHKNENPIPDLKNKFKEVESQPNLKKPKSIIELIFGTQDLDKYKQERSEPYINYEKYKIDKEQRMFDESFYVVDMEDATEQETEDLRILITLVFTHFMSGTTSFDKGRRRDNDRMNHHKEEKTKEENSEEYELINEHNLINSKKVDRLFQKSTLRDIFIKECVKRIPEMKQHILISKECFANLTVVLKSIIDNSIKTNERDPAKFLDLMRILNTYNRKEGEDKRYLFQEFYDCQMFKDIALWNYSFKALFKRKKMDLEKGSKTGGTMLNPWRVIQGIQSFIVKKNVEEEDALLKNEAVDQINYFLINANLPLELATEILTLIVKENGIEMNLLASMVDQLQNKSMLMELTQFIKSKKSHESMERKYGRVLAIRLTIEYLNSPKDLYAVISVNKEWNSKLRQRVLKQLLRTATSPPDSLRRNLYKALLDIKRCPTKYLGKNVDSVQLEETIEEVIKMDVVRSFPTHTDFNSESLRRLLKNVAIEYRDNASYCQGMNYVMGFFMIEFGSDEETNYTLFAQLLEKHLMPIFVDNFSNLQMNFYILDRFNSLFIPDLWEHFREERILPVFYSSSWFITMFTNTLQYTKKSHIILWMMDFFIAEGTKGLFKCIIVLLKYLRFKFVKMSFDQIMNFMSEMTKKEIFTNVFYDQYLRDCSKGETEEVLKSKYRMYWEDFRFLNTFREKVLGVKVRSELITHLENKYKAIKQKMSSKL